MHAWGASQAGADGRAHDEAALTNRSRALLSGIPAPSGGERFLLVEGPDLCSRRTDASIRRKLVRVLAARWPGLHRKEQCL